MRLVTAVRATPGYRATRLAELGMERSLDRGLVKHEAVQRKAVILTHDGDYLDEVAFRICTHPRVLVIRTHCTTAGTEERLLTLLRSRLYKLCKHASVRLQDDVVYVQSEHRGPLTSLRYEDLTSG